MYVLHEPGCSTIIENGYRVLIFCDAERLNPSNDSVDIEVVFDSGERYIATFFTLANIQALMNSAAEEDAETNGHYFWASDMVIVPELTYDHISDTIRAMLAESDYEFGQVFTRIITEDEAEESS